MNDLTVIENDDSHPLLEPVTPTYTKMTVRRASIVWLHCGQVNDFKYVCNYFHYLESLEETLKPETRVKSRLLEFNLLTNQPPKSLFLNEYYTNLYKGNGKANVTVLDDMAYNDFVFNLQGYEKLKKRTGISTDAIVKASQMIRKYCKAYSKSFRTLLTQFQAYTKICKLEFSVNNMAKYIMRNYLKDELVLCKKMPINFPFLEDEDTMTAVWKALDSHMTKLKIRNHFTIQAKSASNLIGSPIKMTTLIKEARREENLSIYPDKYDLGDNKRDRQFIYSKILERHNRSFEGVDTVSNF